MWSPIIRMLGRIFSSCKRWEFSRYSQRNCFHLWKHYAWIDKMEQNAIILFLEVEPLFMKNVEDVCYFTARTLHSATVTYFFTWVILQCKNSTTMMRSKSWEKMQFWQQVVNFYSWENKICTQALQMLSTRTATVSKSKAYTSNYFVITFYQSKVFFEYSALYVDICKHLIQIWKWMSLHIVIFLYEKMKLMLARLI